VRFHFSLLFCESIPGRRQFEGGRKIQEGQVGNWVIIVKRQKCLLKRELMPMLKTETAVLHFNIVAASLFLLCAATDAWCRPLCRIEHAFDRYPFSLSGE